MTTRTDVKAGGKRPPGLRTQRHHTSREPGPPRSTRLPSRSTRHDDHNQSQGRRPPQRVARTGRSARQGSPCASMLRATGCCTTSRPDSIRASTWQSSARRATASRHWSGCCSVVAEGAFTVDGLPLDGARLPFSRRETACVDPAVHLWNRSLLDNVRYPHIRPAPHGGRHDAASHWPRHGCADRSSSSRAESDTAQKATRDPTEPRRQAPASAS